MPLEIVYYGHPALRAKGRRIENITPEICEFAQQMIETMYRHDGCGLAAHQVGRPVQMAVIDIISSMKNRESKAWIHGKSVDIKKLMPLVLINPEIIPIGKKTTSDTEGCLSIPGLYAEVERAKRIKIRYQDLTGKFLELEAEGLLARAAMHEVDHLHGILLIDHLSSEERTEHQVLLQKLARENGMN